MGILFHFEKIWLETHIIYTEWLQGGLYHVNLTHILVIKRKDCAWV